jgi:hypothetical protein
MTTPRKRVNAWAAVMVFVAACGSDGVMPNDDRCATVALPLSGGANGPTVTEVVLEVQSSVVTLALTATDPQGSDNLRAVTQTARIFTNLRCEGSPIVLTDDIAYSGLEETFGTVVEAAQNRMLYDLMSAAANWPVQVELADRDGNTTAGRVRARIER